ncbi:MAG: hypothetical protein R3C18_07025 [Planctomycetaceae bacterium]
MASRKQSEKTAPEKAFRLGLCHQFMKLLMGLFSVRSQIDLLTVDLDVPTLVRLAEPRFSRSCHHITFQLEMKKSQASKLKGLLVAPGQLHLLRGSISCTSFLH